MILCVHKGAITNCFMHAHTHTSCARAEQSDSIEIDALFPILFSWVFVQVLRHMIVSFRDFFAVPVVVHEFVIALRKCAHD